MNPSATRSVVVQYRLGLPDLYLMYVTTWWTPVFVCVALFLLAAPLNSQVTDPSGDVAAGLVFAVMGLVLLPLGHASMTGSIGRVGKPVTLRLDAAGVRGWPIAGDLDIKWSDLKRPRIESLVVVLPFNPPLSARRAWVAIPKRAMTVDQADQLLALLREQGFLKRGDGRSVTGRVLGLLLDRLPMARWRREGHDTLSSKP